MSAGPSGRSCTVDGCDRANYGRGLCRAHHQRWRRTGEPGPAEILSPAPRDATCTVEGCDQPHEARGYCATHYSRWRRTGDVHPSGRGPVLDSTECAQLYRDGASAAALGRRYGHTPRTILTALRAAGVPIRAPGPHPRPRHRPP
ncbi:MAG: hypothetical protein ACRDRW_02175 [Pseudonocardiaceae bacterium]